MSGYYTYIVSAYGIVCGYTVWEMLKCRVTIDRLALAARVDGTIKMDKMKSLRKLMNVC